MYINTGSNYIRKYLYNFNMIKKQKIIFFVFYPGINITVLQLSMFLCRSSILSVPRNIFLFLFFFIYTFLGWINFEFTCKIK